MFMIGDLALDRPLLLAPMEDVSDQAFRLMDGERAQQNLVVD